MAAPSTTQTPRPIVMTPDEGESLWFNNDLLTFKATGGNTGGRILLVEELARRGKVTPLHLHPEEEEETFYVLDGEALFHLDGHDETVRAGSFASVPPGVRHAYLVTSEVARTPVLVTPGSGAMEAFFGDAGEPAGERVLPPERPLDIERIARGRLVTDARLSARVLAPRASGSSWDSHPGQLLPYHMRIVALQPPVRGMPVEQKGGLGGISLDRCERYPEGASVRRQCALASLGITHARSEGEA